jgi:hypothetical protein
LAGGRAFDISLATFPASFAALRVHRNMPEMLIFPVDLP